MLHSSEREQIDVWCYCGKPTDLNELTYPITSLLLSILSPGFILDQSGKAGWNNIIKTSNSVSSTFTQIAKFIDGMAAMHFLKPRSTYGEQFNDLLKYITPLANVKVHSLEILMDMSTPKSVNEWTRTQRSNNPRPNMHKLSLQQKYRKLMVGNVF